MEKIVDHEMHNPKRMVLMSVMVPTLGAFVVVFVTGGIFRDILFRFSSTIYYPSLGIFTSVSVFTILFWRTRHFNMQSKILLLLMSICLVLFNLINTFEWKTSQYYPPLQRPIGHPLLNLADSLLIMFIVITYFHFVSLRYRDFTPLPSSFVILLAAPGFLTTNLEIVFQDETSYAHLQYAMGYFLPLLGIATIGVAIFVIHVSYKIYSSTTILQIRQGSFEIIGSVIFLSYAFVSQALTRDTFNFAGVEIRILQLLLFVIGTTLFTFVYAKRPIFTYALPIRLQEMIIYSAGGIPIWDICFTHPTENARTGLKTSALTAIGELVKDLSGFKGRIKELILEDGNLLLNHYQKYSFCIIADSISMQLRNSLIEFSNQLDDYLMKKEDMNWGVMPDPEEFFVPLVTKFFPIEFTTSKLEELKT